MTDPLVSKGALAASVRLKSGGGSVSRSRDGLPVILVGGGGHGRVVLDALRSAGHSVVAVCDPDPDVARRLPSDIVYLGDDEALETYAPDSVALANGLGSTASTATRRTLFERLTARGYRFLSVRHPNACIADDVVLGEGTQILAGAIVQTGVRLGANVIVNTGAQADHDCEIGDHVHLAPGVVLSGGVRIGAGCHVGAGAVVIQSIVIGPNTLIGAGAVVVRDVEPGSRLLRMA